MLLLIQCFNKTVLICNWNYVMPQTVVIFLKFCTGIIVWSHSASLSGATHHHHHQHHHRHHTDIIIVS